MNSFATCSLLALLLAPVGAGCAADRPQDEAEPAPPPPVVPMDAGTTLAPPPSALGTAVSVCERLEEFGSDTVRLRRLEARTVLGNDDQPDRIHVKLDMVVRGADAIESTSRYVNLLDAMSAAEWCENVRRAPTSVTNSGTTLEVYGLEILAQPQAVDWQAGQADEDTALLARSLAAEYELGSIDLQVANRNTRSGSRTTIFRLRPTDRLRALELDTIFAFAQPLEARTNNLSVTAIELFTRGGARSNSNEWTYRLQLTGRSNPEAAGSGESDS